MDIPQFWQPKKNLCLGSYSETPRTINHEPSTTNHQPRTTEKPGLVLLSMLVVAALIHILAFSLFRPVFSEFRRKPISSATIYLTHQDSPNASLFNRWLEAADPSLFVRTRVVTTLTFPKIRYTPSYTTEHLVLAPPLNPVSRIPIPLGPAPAPVNLCPPVIQKHFTLSSAPMVGTRLALAGELAGRHLKKLPPQGILISPSKLSLPCTFLVAVNPTGDIHNIFLLRSSGNSELDQLAMDNLRQVQLEPLESKKATWGTITYLWGTPKERNTNHEVRDSHDSN